MSHLYDLAVLYEHPHWQEPLFAALDARRVDYIPIDLKRAAYSSDDAPPARVVFNQASPSAYVRDHERAVPHALAYMRHLERLGCDAVAGAALGSAGRDSTGAAARLGGTADGGGAVVTGSGPTGNASSAGSSGCTSPAGLMPA